MQNFCAANVFTGHLELRKHSGERVGVLVQQMDEKLKGNTQWKEGERLNLCAVFFIISKKRQVYNYADLIKTVKNCTTKAIQEKSGKHIFP